MLVKLLFTRVVKDRESIEFRVGLSQNYAHSGCYGVLVCKNIVAVRISTRSCSGFTLNPNPPYRFIFGCHTFGFGKKKEITVYQKACFVYCNTVKHF